MGPARDDFAVSCKTYTTPHINPLDQIPDWRAALLQVASWRPAVAGKLTDDELLAYACAEFDRIGSRFYGFQYVSRATDGSAVRAVLSAPDEQIIRADAPTEAEALGRALADYLAQNPRRNSSENRASDGA